MLYIWLGDNSSAYFILRMHTNKSVFDKYVRSISARALRIPWNGVRSLIPLKISNKRIFCWHIHKCASQNWKSKHSNNLVNVRRYIQWEKFFIYIEKWVYFEFCNKKIHQFNAIQQNYMYEMIYIKRFQKTNNQFKSNTNA